MSKPNKPSGIQGRRRQNSNKKSGGKERIDATLTSVNTVSEASAETVSAPADIVSALAETASAPADTVSALANPFSAAADAAPEVANAVPPPALPAPAPAKTVPIPASAVATPTNTPPMPGNTFSRGIQTIATAYGDYTKKSLEDTRCFVEKLAGVRSLDKALEVQAEYAKTAYETFVAESQKIRGLYSDLAKQTFRPFEGFTAKRTRAAR
jgi:hypothetical protein